MRGDVFAHVLIQKVRMILVALSCAHSFAQPFYSYRRNILDEFVLAAGLVPSVRSETLDENSTARGRCAIPAGTILPVRLNSTVSSAKSKPGQMITGRIMQEVPLSSGIRIKEGSKVVG